MSEDPIECARRQLSKAREIAESPHWSQGADKILTYSEIVESLQSLLAFLEAYRSETQQLIALVEQLGRATLQASPDGSMPSWTELRGNAGTAFRNALRAILMHVESMEQPREH